MSANRINKKFLSDVDSRDLIKEIRNRPGLYNSSMLEPPRKDHKQTLWQEVGERLTDTDVWEGYTNAEREARLDEIREKWRHLRNNFLREIKLMRSGEKKRKYIFFDDMEFMTPFVGVKIRGPNKVKRERYDDSGQDSAEERKIRKQAKTKRSLKYEDSSHDSEDETDFIQQHFDAMDEESNEEQEEGEDAGQNNPRRVSPRRTIKTKAKQISATKTTAPKQKLTKEQEMIIKRFDVIKKIPLKVAPIPLRTTTASSTAASTAAGTRHVVAATGNPNRLSLRFFDMRDSDISFCMSMVSTFRKLGEAKKLRAKIDMLKVLHKYADNLDETPKTRVRNEQMHRRKPVVTNNDQSTEDDVDQSMEDHSKENGADVKSEAKLNETGATNVWWT